MTAQKCRPLSVEEKKILDVLLREPFPGRDEIREQIRDSQVSEWPDGSGSLEFETLSKVIAPVLQRVPVEGAAGQGVDLIQVLLHVVLGKIKHLEFVNYREETVIPPRAGDIVVKINQGSRNNA